MPLDLFSFGSRLTASTAIATACVLGTVAAAPAGAAPPTAPASVSAIAPAPEFKRIAYSALVEEIQQGLNDLGYDAGPEDGLMGTRTRSAIVAYQRDQGLAVTGDPSRRLGGHIDSRVAARGEASPPPREQTAETEAPAANDTLVAIQGHLRRLGHDVTLSGRMTAQTEAAITDYQRRHGLLVTGQPSTALRDHMEQTLAERGDDGVADPASPRTIGRVQQALNARGYTAGPADGVMGPSTRSAIRTYQADADLPITGSVTVALLERLEAMPGADDPSPQPDTPDDPAPTWQSVFQDGFDDAASLAGTRWQAVNGEVSVSDGALLTQVTPPRRQEPEEVGRELLKSVLGQALGVSMAGRDNRAVAARPASLDNGTFRLQAAVNGTAVQDGAARFNIGLYEGNDAASGLRLLYVGDNPRPWRLVSTSGQEVTTLASAAGGPSLADDARHDIDWQRDADGAMTVRVDGATVLRTGASEADAQIAGVSMINGGGTWRLHDVAVETLTD